MTLSFLWDSQGKHSVCTENKTRQRWCLGPHITVQNSSEPVPLYKGLLITPARVAWKKLIKRLCCPLQNRPGLDRLRVPCGTTLVASPPSLLVNILVLLSTSQQTFLFCFCLSIDALTCFGNILKLIVMQSCTHLGVWWLGNTYGSIL